MSLIVNGMRRCISLNLKTNKYAPFDKVYKAVMQLYSQFLYIQIKKYIHKFKLLWTPMESDKIAYVEKFILMPVDVHGVCVAGVFARYRT